MITAILIDDEVTSLESLKLAIEQYCPDVEIIGVYSAPEKGLEAIKKASPDLVFLDVQMPGMSGFEILQQASPITFDVIFVSAYDKYAIKAIHFSALDYLLKPVDIDELIRAVKKVREKLNQANAYQYQSILNNIQLKAGKVGKLAVPSLEGIDFFNIQDIIFCKADGSYTTIILKGGEEVVVCKNLKDFENMLTDAGFCRVHHSYLVNLSHVLKYIKGDGGYILLTDNHHVAISRRKREEFLGLHNKA
jgi:two-component system, LytTR family, response regulator